MFCFFITEIFIAYFTIPVFCISSCIYSWIFCFNLYETMISCWNHSFVKTDFILKFFRSAIERIAMSIEALLHRVVASILFDGRSDKGRGWVHEYAFHKVASLGNEPLTSCPKSGPQRASRLLLLRSIAQVGLRLALRQRQNRPAGTTPHQQAKGPRLSCYPTPTCTGCQGAMRFACIR
jgi:hypothetical protein